MSSKELARRVLGVVSRSKFTTRRQGAGVPVSELRGLQGVSVSELRGLQGESISVLRGLQGVSVSVLLLLNENSFSIFVLVSLAAVVLPGVRPRFLRGVEGFSYISSRMSFAR